eukprot:CAMPEP_0172496010 /NCGR_PEP_ID=MMETSP1066-20121228/79851_1 /TAXON_ID=671091 /ORGANISM="Coscinodiscus wailesii, Strain CCMP2513" /LENGTH=151 /DNA_ID=CAMNT_0013268059 /DNA_START=202 /DNA_END=657 /DNA_ORIENTATION=+
MAGACHASWFPDPVTEVRFRGTTIPTGDTTWRALGRTMGAPVVLFSAVALSFSFGECLAESVRGKRDQYNAGFGGMLAGSVMGALTKNPRITATATLGVGAFMTLADFSGAYCCADDKSLYEKMYGTLPEKWEDNDTLKSLKEKYPKFKDL